MIQQAAGDTEIGSTAPHLALDAWLTRLAEGLAAQTSAAHGLWDPVLDAPTPVDHYGNTGAALGLALAGEGYQDASRWALDAWRAVPDRQIGHLPFNRLFLLLGASASHGVPSDRPDPAWPQAIDRCPLRRRYPSNNWVMLAQLCRLVAADTSAARARACRRLCALLDDWTTPAGGFIDFPRRSDGPVATPFAYHHKALFVAVAAAWFHDDPVLDRPIQRLLDWVLMAWDGAGYVGGFGRSSHALFGDGCLLAALVLLGACRGDRAHTPEGRLAACLLQRLSGQFRTDGLLWLNPGGAVGQGAWDAYMHLSVYNAWAAGIVAWSRHMVATHDAPACLAGIHAPRHDPGSGTQDHQAGLARYAAPSGLTALVSTRGQPPQGLSRDTVELRYAGGQPLHIATEGQVLCPPPVRIPLRELLARPARAGWVPVLLIDGEPFGVTDFHAVRVETCTEWYTVTLRAHPTALTRPRPRGIGGRLRSGLEWRLPTLGGSRRTAQIRSVHESIDARLRLHIHRYRWCVEVEGRLIRRGDGPVATYLNPAGHLLARSAWPCARKITLGTPNDTGSAADIEGVALDMVEQPTAVGTAVAASAAACPVTDVGVLWSVVLEWTNSAGGHESPHGEGVVPPARDSHKKSLQR